jgi:hypothetical protein
MHVPPTRTLIGVEDTVYQMVRRQADTLIPDEPMTPELLAQLQPTIRAVLLNRANQVYRDVGEDIAESANSERGTDPRLHKLRLDSIEMMLRLAGLNKPPVSVPEETAGGSLTVEEQRRLVLEEIERV